MQTIDSSKYTPFELEVVPDRDEVAVVVQGELDMATADALHDAVRVLETSGFGSIVVDLRGIGFIDSTGLQVLISLRNDAKRNGHALTLIPAGPAASRIFDITRTRGLFDWRERFIR